MILTLQCTASCRACGHATTPINGALTETPCRKCGAVLNLPASLWAAALEGIAYAAGDLAEQASGHETFTAQGATLRVAFHRVQPQCPHCESSWPRVPAGEAWACPHCQTAISLRADPFASGEAITLIAEDLGVESVEGVVLHCRGCGSPLDPGSQRRTQCRACMSDNVVPDSIYRRLNAPDLAARWMVRLAQSEGPHPLMGVGAHHLALGGDGILYIVGTTSHLDFALLAFDPRARTLLWTVDLQACDIWPYPIPIGDGRVALVAELQSKVWFAHKGGLAPGFDFGELILDATLHAGDLVLCVHPLRSLVRVGLDGSKRDMWPRVGFFARLFGGGGARVAGERPRSRPLAIWPGRLGVGHDGGLRMVWGSSVIRYLSDGELVWSKPIPEALVSIQAPVAAQDGTTYAVVAVGQEAMRLRLIRISPDGSQVATILDADHIVGPACEPDGRVWVMAGNHEEGVGMHMSLQCYDASGNLVWKGPSTM